MLEDTLVIETSWQLQCDNCGKAYDKNSIQTYAVCCNQPLIVNYSLKPSPKDRVNMQDESMWRYRSLLPVNDVRNIVTLGEGWTPVHTLTRTSADLQANVLLKDEAVNPTGSFKARGISAAISKAKELGINSCVIPTAGNAGGALSAYCAKAGIKGTVIMPEHTPATLKEECLQYGAELILVKGLINACGAVAKEVSAETGAFDMSTLKEPYRLEGKKTMGYEIAEQLNWNLPDVIIYPTGGGTGFIGIWKALKEMISLGWIKGDHLPRMVAVQTHNCDPVVQYFNAGKLRSNYTPQATKAYGLAVPYPFAIKQLLQVLYESNGIAIAVDEDRFAGETKQFASREGLLLSPEGIACYMALKQLRSVSWIQPGETVLMLNTGSWYKYR